jgi:hypothetical protein
MTKRSGLSKNDMAAIHTATRYVQVQMDIIDAINSAEAACPRNGEYPTTGAFHRAMAAHHRRMMMLEEIGAEYNELAMSAAQGPVPS